MHSDPQDDLVTVVALARFHHDFEEVDPILSDRAWRLAVAIAASHGLSPLDALRQLEWHQPRA